MNIVFIQPLYEKCGIRIYADDLADALKTTRTTVQKIDIKETANNLHAARYLLTSCDCIHIQYDPSFLLDAPKSFLRHLRKMTGKPIVVTLHEVYHTHPDVFPREQITGFPLLKKLKQFRYDRTHPYQTIWQQDLANSFYADAIIVHSAFQKKILTDSGVSNNRIHLLPYPVDRSAPVHSPRLNAAPFRLAASGFINPAFDYNLLIDVLKKIKKPWHFTWIGGLRSSSHQNTLDQFLDKSEQAGLRSSITVTGWVDTESRRNHLAEKDCILALFKHRSSSGSLAAAIAARIPIIATPIPLTQELETIWHCCTTVEPDANALAEAIAILQTDRRLQSDLIDGCDRYVRANNLDETGIKTNAIYQAVCQ